MEEKKVMILGVTGMLGHTLFRELNRYNNFDVYGTVRTLGEFYKSFSPAACEKVIPAIDADNFDSIIKVVSDIKPDVIINCIGLIKQLPIAKEPLPSININALFPHRLALFCKASGIRMIHISTDCVFTGKTGGYKEEEPSDAMDLYGRTKYLGEVYYSHTVTLRTSIIGHELKGGYGLVEWFLAQKSKVKGFTRAIYTGFPTVEFARIISDYVIPNVTLKGLYHISSKPVSKYDLLRLIAVKYKKDIEIDPYEEFVCDRSLNSQRFFKETGYISPSWPDLIGRMYCDFKNYKFYKK